MNKSTPAENEQSLDFVVRLRLLVEGSNLDELRILRVNLSYGGPDWQRTAVTRAIDKVIAKMW